MSWKKQLMLESEKKLFESEVIVDILKCNIELGELRIKI